MSAVPARHLDRTIPLTRHARRTLEARARRLRDRVIPELAGLLQEPDHDSRYDEDYYRATRQLEELSELLARAEPVESRPDDPSLVELGDAVTVRFDDGTLERYLIVHPAEVTLGGLRVSAASPLGAALLGRFIGEAVDVEAPGGAYRCEIVGTERQPHAVEDP
ncbi:MAG TPA: GreA/GreB family elongation factor, partial [Acidimicrobiia bacterium]|nr:GreA/GreB family elongation factor [Acidimicrobiia bacterium]